MKAAEPAFNAVVHSPLRLQICAMLSQGGEVEFAVLRHSLDTSDATLSKHLRTLLEAGFVGLRRVPRAKGQARTWVKLTEAGSKAFSGHFAFLLQMAPP